MDLLKNLDVVDTEIQEAINKELSRQRDKLEMIASENIVSKAVMQAQGSVLYLVQNMQMYNHIPEHKQIQQYILLCYSQEILF